MAISQRQFNHLNEIGIKVWQQRNTSSSESVNNSDTDVNHLLPIDSKALSQSVFFIDILHSIKLSIGEVIIENNVINLGLFNWQFIETDSISFSNSTLSSPVISTIQNSHKLKKALWNIIKKEVLT